MRTLCLFVFPMAAALLAALLLPEAAVWAVLALAALGVPASLLLRRWKHRRRVFVACFGVLFAIGALWAYHALRITPAQKLEGMQFDGVVTVHTLPGKTAYGTSATVRFSKDGRQYRAVLYLNEDIPELRPGDELRGSFQVAAYNRDRDMTLRYGYSTGVPLRLTTDGAWTRFRPERLSWREWPASWAWHIQKLHLFPADVEGLFHALLTGDKSGLGYPQKNAMQICGVYHMVAVSGMHVSVLLTFLVLLLGRGRKRLAVFGIPMLLLFTLMAGASPGTVRALLLCALSLLAPLVRREPDAPTSLAFGLLVLLGQNPYAVLHVGLQLSFLAVAGLLLFARPVHDFLYAKLSRKKHRVRNRIARWFSASVSATVGASLLTLPLTAYYFGLVSLIAPVANLLFLWIVTGLFAGGFLVCLLGVLFRPLGAAAGWVLAWPARVVLGGTMLLSRLPFAAVYTTSNYIVFFLIYAYLALALVLAAKKGQRRWTAVPMVAGALCLCLLLSALEARLAVMRFAALDVGQGQCLVLTAGGRSVMVDCGGSNPDDAGETAARYLNSLGSRRLDALVVSHYDADHCMGVLQLLQRIEVTDAFLPDLEDDSGNRAAVLSALEAAGTKVHFVEEDLLLTVGTGSVTIFAPRSYENDNDGCLAVLASFGDYDILATGDLTARMERRLLHTAQLPDIEVLVAGHHGAKTSTSADLLRALRPEFVLISVGENNRYGHPAAQTLERIAAAGAQVFRTDLHGTITVKR